MTNDNPYASDIMQGKELIRKEDVKRVIDKYIVTDLHGIPKKQCTVLWKIKKELKL